MLKKPRRLVVILLTFIVLGIGAGVAVAAPLQQTVAAVPILDRLSWGAVLAGVVLALIMQLVLNLAGISLGFAGVNPRSSDNLGSEMGSLSRGTAIWIGVSTLAALFIGGWVAGHFAGTPDRVDGFLHGMLVWSAVTLVSMALLLTSLGRLLSGVSDLVAHALNLAGRAAQATAVGAANVAGATVHGAANVAGATLHSAANVAGATARGAANVAGAAAHQVGEAAQSAAQQVGEVAQNAAEQRSDTVQQTPEGRRLAQAIPMNQGRLDTDAVMERIKEEARQLLTQMGVTPERVQAQVQAARGDIQQAVQQVTDNPQDAQTVLFQALDRVVNRGREVVSDVDRQNLVSVLTSRTRLTETQAREVLRRWETRAQQARTEATTTVQDARWQLETARDQVEEKVDDVRGQVENKVEEVRGQVEQTVDTVRDQVEDKVEELRYNAERAAREVAQHTSEAIAMIAGAVCIFIVIGGFAAGLGGMLGSPQEVPAQDVNTTSSVPQQLPTVEVLATPLSP